MPIKAGIIKSTSTIKVDALLETRQADAGSWLGGSSVTLPACHILIYSSSSFISAVLCSLFGLGLLVKTSQALVHHCC